MDIYGILAHPTKHSLSPAMHNAGFKALNLGAEYQRFDIPPEDLKQFIQRVRDEGIKGLNVSTPHKENVMPLLDIIDDVATTIGAVNTIVNKDGELHGTNVDWQGVQGAIEEVTSIEGKRAVILGAGGAARAAVFALQRSNAAEVVILNRTMEHAKELAKEFNCKADALSSFNKYNSQIVVQATSAGMNKPEGVEIVPRESLTSEMTVMEMIYSPLETRILKDAKDAGAKTITGDRMLLNQGFACFQIWTGEEAPRKEMEDAIREHLN
ncbi:shikimate dehydrogenase [Patescibacteria group bacterium]